nr:hypothetical protein [Tanacetum cinerariifolium]
MKKSDAYKTYYDLATGKVIPKPKYVRRSTREKTVQAPKSSPGKRLKATTKVAKSGKKKLPAKGMETLSEVAFGSGANEGIGVIPGVPDVPTYGSNDEKISRKSNDDENDDDQDDDNADDEDHDGQDNVNELTGSDNDGDDFVHPKSSTFDEEECHEEKLDEKEEDRVKALEDDFSEFKQTNLFAEAVSSILSIVDKYLANQMNEAIKAAVQLQSDRLRDEPKAKNEDFINKIDENIKKIVKEQVKVQVFKILPRIEKFVNEQLKAEVLTHSSNKSKTYHAVAANISELELKKNLKDKIESNKLIHQSVQQKTLYKALIDAYETNKFILKTYGDTVTLKDVEMMRMKTKNPPLDQTGGPREEDLEKNLSQLVHQMRRLLSQPAHLKKGPSLKQGSKSKTSTLALNEDPRESFNELIDTPLDFLALMLNRLNVDTLTLKLLAGPTFELMKGSCKSLVELEYFLEEVCKATTDQLDWNNPEEQIIAIKKLTIVEWHNYKHLEWITVRRDDDKLYTFKEGDYNRLRLQDIEDMLLLLVQGKLTNLNIKERLALGVSLRMFTRSIVYQNKKNILMRIDELHKFSNGTLNNVWYALDDTLKRIQMKFLSQTIWREVDRERAGAMIQAIDRQLRNKRIRRSLEKFDGGRLYGGDLRPLERTI